MTCWCAACKTMVDVVRQESSPTVAGVRKIMRGLCVVCGGAIGAIGVYVPVAAVQRD